MVLLGPLINRQTCGIERPNFHFLGPKNYAELPNYLKAFDVCLMPFCLSELTLHISPTKTPEYLAGGKPVVSTAIPDVIQDYADVVSIAHNHDEFLEMVEQALAASDPELHKKLRRKAETKSWRHVAESMEKLILEL